MDDNELKDFFNDIANTMQFSKISKIIPYMIGHNNCFENIIKQINSKSNLKSGNLISSINDDEKLEKKDLRKYDRFKKFNIEDFKRKLEKIANAEIKSQKNKNKYKLKINDRTKHNIEIWKKNKQLSDFVKRYNPKYKLIYKRIPNVFFSFPKKNSKKKNKSVNNSRKKLKKNEEKFFEKNESFDRNNNSEIENSKINYNNNNESISFNSLNSRNHLPHIFSSEKGKKRIVKEANLKKFNSAKILKRNSLLQSNKSQSYFLSEKKYYYPDYSKISKKERLSFSNIQNNNNDELINQPSIGAYEPKYEFIYEKSPQISFTNKFMFDIKSYRKYIIKKLWSGFNRHLTEDYELVDLPPLILTPRTDK